MAEIFSPLKIILIYIVFFILSYDIIFYVHKQAFTCFIIQIQDQILQLWFTTPQVAQRVLKTRFFNLLRKTL
jgi:hypothetical protein